jgi:hypothetical protein
MKNQLVKLLFVFLSVLSVANLFAQEYDDNGKEIKQYQFHMMGLSYGFNFGAYFPNNKIASFYDGEPDNKLSLEKTIHTNYIYSYSNGTTTANSSYIDINKNVFNSDGFYIYSYPLKMKYSAVTNIGFHAKYNFTDRMGMYIEFNYSKLKAIGNFSLMDSIGRNYKKAYDCSLLATESRVDMNLGLTKSFGKPGRFMPYAEAALNMNNTIVISADALVGGNKYSYLDPYYQQFHYRYGGIGFGTLLGGGFQIIATQTLVLHTGIDFSLKRIHLGDNSAYSLNTVLYIRILFYKLITTTPEP